MIWFSLGTAGELIKIFPLIRFAQEKNISWLALATGQSPINLVNQWNDFGLPQEKLQFLNENSNDLHSLVDALRWFFKANIKSNRNLKQKIGKSNKTDFWVVHGDTLSTLTGAIYGLRMGIPVVHLEAGLRSPSLLNPFPEEITRRMVSRFAHYHFCQDQLAVDNLFADGIKGKIISTNGNTLLDAVRRVVREFPIPPLPTAPYVVANLHRFENLNSPTRWKIMVDVLIRASSKNPVHFVLHPPTKAKLDSEPQTKERLQRAGVCFLPRLPFTKFSHILNAANYVISDGGSNQEECFYLGKPCLLLRTATERQEGLGSTCVLSNFEEEKIQKFLANPDLYRREAIQPKESPTEIFFRELGGGA